MDNGASSYRRFLDGDDRGIAEIVENYKDGLIKKNERQVRNLLYRAKQSLRSTLEKEGFIYEE